MPKLLATKASSFTQCSSLRMYQHRTIARQHTTLNYQFESARTFSAQLYCAMQEICHQLQKQTLLKFWFLKQHCQVTSSKLCCMLLNLPTQLNGLWYSQQKQMYVSQYANSNTGANQNWWFTPVHVCFLPSHFAFPSHLEI